MLSGETITQNNFGIKYKIILKKKDWVLPDKDEVIESLIQNDMVDCLDFIRKKSNITLTNTGENKKWLDQEISTVWVNNPLLRIDYVLVSKKLMKCWKINNWRVLTECKASDHFPVLTELEEF